MAAAIPQGKTKNTGHRRCLLHDGALSGAGSGQNLGLRWFVITEEGEIDLQPTTDDGWFAVEHAAIVVAEGGNLLMLDGGYAADQADWAEYAQGLTRAGLTWDAAEQQDADALFAAGGEIYSVAGPVQSLR